MDFRLHWGIQTEAFLERSPYHTAKSGLSNDRLFCREKLQGSAISSMSKLTGVSIIRENSCLAAT
jgi:hypothetical protein